MASEELPRASRAASCAHASHAASGAPGTSGGTSSLSTDPYRRVHCQSWADLAYEQLQTCTRHSICTVGNGSLVSAIRATSAGSRTPSGSGCTLSLQRCVMVFVGYSLRARFCAHSVIIACMSTAKVKAWPILRIRNWRHQIMPVW